VNPSLMDCWIGCSLAELHVRQLVAEGQRERFVDRHCPASTIPWRVPATVRRELGLLLVRGGQRLLGAQVVAEPDLRERPVAVS
jgi:hypothetical protein